MRNNRPSPYAINVDTIAKLVGADIKTAELELAAALKNGAVNFIGMPRQERLRICEEAAAISRFIDVTDEKRVTLHDMMDALLDDPGHFEPEAFMPQDAWYEALLGKTLCRQQA